MGGGAAGEWTKGWDAGVPDAVGEVIEEICGVGWINNWCQYQFGAQKIKQK